MLIYTDCISYQENYYVGQTQIKTQTYLYGFKKKKFLLVGMSLVKLWWVHQFFSYWLGDKIEQN